MGILIDCIVVKIYYGYYSQVVDDVITFNLAIYFLCYCIKTNYQKYHILMCIMIKLKKDISVQRGKWKQTPKPGKYGDNSFIPIMVKWY